MAQPDITALVKGAF